MNAANVLEYTGVRVGDGTKKRKENKFVSGAEKTQKKELPKELLPSPSNMDFSLDQLHANFVAWLATQMDIMTVTKKKTSSLCAGCAGDVITEYTPRSVRMPLTRRELKRRQ